MGSDSHSSRSRTGQRSAGILLYRRRGGTLEVLLGHPGGPYWTRRDAGAWTLPKGGIAPGEAPLDAARREFEEEIGFAPPGEPRSLGALRQRGGKLVLAWAVEGDFDPETLRSTPVAIEWPPRSGRTLAFPEIDRAAWFGLEEARLRILPGQAGFLDALHALPGIET